MSTADRPSSVRLRAAGDDRIAAFYPSLFYPSLQVGVAMAHELLGNTAAARAALERAAEHVAALPAAAYGEQLRTAVSEGLGRLR
jgi:hypothetical protein